MPSPLHPALVHLPLGLALATPLLSGGIVLAAWRGWLPRRAWVAAVALQGLLVAGGVAAVVTGHRDGDRVEKVVGEEAVDAHEERAEAFVWTAGAVLALAAAALAVPARAAAPLAALSLAGMVAAAVLAYRAGQAGGELVYRHGAARAWGAGAAGPPAAVERHEDEGRER
ncbi:MAG TPA: DUF2231 domain-containing protein [Anaeromyxobacteraceae bacterium]|nr:DUF2231 domain-containing protein [Anaeromyxobacteraceae bacterium]